MSTFSVTSADLQSAVSVRTAATARVHLPVSEASPPMAHSTSTRRELTVELENGLHMTPCSAIAKAVREFGGPVRIIHGKITADASSVFDLLGLGAAHGTVLTLEADGDGAERLVERLAELVRKEGELRR